MLPFSKSGDKAVFTENPKNTTLCPFNPPLQEQKAETYTEEHREYVDDQPVKRLKRERQGNRAPPPGYVCRRCNVPGHFVSECPDINVRRDTQPCWFCLSSPKVATHLIVAVGEHAYLAMARGPLIPFTVDQHSSVVNKEHRIPGGGHVLIVAIEHYSSLELVTDSSAKDALILETAKFQMSIRELYRQYQCVAVKAEVVREGKVQHYHCSMVPIPAFLVGQLCSKIRQTARNEKLVYKEYSNDQDVEKFEQWFSMRVDDPSDTDKAFIFVFPLQGDQWFDVRFGRRVLASLLQLESRVDWRQCGETQEDEVNGVEEFKTAYDPWNFTK